MHITLTFCFFFFFNVEYEQDPYNGYENVKQKVAMFRQRVLMSPRIQFQALPSGTFLEKNWSHLVVNAWDSHKNNYFLRKYENFKEKEWSSRSGQ